MKSIIRFTLSASLFVLTLLIVEHYIGWAAIGESVALLTPGHLFLLGLLSFASYILRMCRICLSFRLFGPLHMIRLLHLSCSHNLLNLLLPMRAGEAAFPILMKRSFDVSMAHSTSHLLLYRMLDLSALLGIAVCLFALSYSPWLLFICLLGLALSYCLAHPLKCYSARLLSKLQSKRFHRLSQLLVDLPTWGRSYFYLVGATFLIWLCKISAFMGVVFLLSDLPLLTAIFGIVGAELSSVLPIHGLAGSGTFEGAFVLAGNITSTDLTQLLKISVQLHLYMLLMAFLSVALSWLMTLLIPLQTRLTQAS